MGAGIGDPTRAKALVKCQQKLGKAGAAFAGKKQKLLLGCVAQVQKCLQVTPAKPGCISAASAKCAKSAKTIAALEAKLASDLAKGCRDLDGAPEDLTDLAGLGLGAEASACAAVGVAALDSVADVVLCLGRRLACEADRLLGAAAPRARELLGLAGVDPAVFSCAIDGADGGGQGLGDVARGKALTKCEKGVEKAAATFVKQQLVGLAACIAQVAKCVQQKPGDAACIAKAEAKCDKLEAKLAGPKGPAAKALAAIDKSCESDPADLLDAAGLGHGALATYCAALGVPALASSGDVAECLVRDHRCRVGHLLDASIPRAVELLSLGGISAR
jgi:hypothetical protein